MDTDDPILKRVQLTTARLTPPPLRAVFLNQNSHRRASHEVTMLLICGDREQLFQAWMDSTGERCKAVETLVDAAGMRERSLFQQRLAQVEIAVGLSESALLAYKKHVAEHGCLH